MKSKKKHLPETFDFSTVKLPSKKKVQEIMDKAADRWAIANEKADNERKAALGKMYRGPF